jgi:hypothetical protein
MEAIDIDLIDVARLSHVPSFDRFPNREIHRGFFADIPFVVRSWRTLKNNSSVMRHSLRRRETRLRERHSALHFEISFETKTSVGYKNDKKAQRERE